MFYIDRPLYHLDLFVVGCLGGNREKAPRSEESLRKTYQVRKPLPTVRIWYRVPGKWDTHVTIAGAYPVCLVLRATYLYRVARFLLCSLAFIHGFFNGCASRYPAVLLCPHAPMGDLNPLK